MPDMQFTDGSSTCKNGLISLNLSCQLLIISATDGVEGSLTVWCAAQHVEAEPCLTVDLQWQDADVQCRHWRPEQLRLDGVSVLRAWQRLGKETKRKKKPS